MVTDRGREGTGREKVCESNTFLEPTCGVEEKQINPTAPPGPADLERGYGDSKRLDIR